MDIFLDLLGPLLFDPCYDFTKRIFDNVICSPDSARWKEQLCSHPIYTNLWDRQAIARQHLSIFIFTMSFISVFYLVFGTICYYRNFDPALRSHPKFLKNQIQQEIRDSMLALLFLNVFTAPIFVAQVRGYSNLYDSVASGPGWWYEIAQFGFFFILFSDTCMYWNHRVFHTPVLFKAMHRKHHRYIVPTPFSAYAFDPLEAYITSLPIYAYSFIWPMSKYASLVMFFVTNIWSYLLHDNRDMFHTVHHKNVKVNFGQFLTLWDHLGGTYRDPDQFFEAKQK